jgi:hypothetical protein|tara:strand:- start:44 stop:433 length:390 start_codon:yes stop_codon:yes gene_type:complete
MAVTYSWGITQMTKKTVGEHENVVLHARWELIGTDGTTGTEGRFVGATPIDFNSGSVDEFVAFGELTEELVIGWVSASVTGPSGYWDHISEQIQKKIDEVDDASEEISSEALPWSTGSVTPTPVDGGGE